MQRFAVWIPSVTIGNSGNRQSVPEQKQNFMVFQWLVVCVIVILCAGLAIRAIVRSIRAGLSPIPGDSGGCSASGGCNHCPSSRAGRAIPIVKLESRKPPIGGRLS